MRSNPNVAPRNGNGKGGHAPDIGNYPRNAPQTPNWLIGTQTMRAAIGDNGNRIAPGYGGSVFRDAGNSGRIATDQAARAAAESILREEAHRARQERKAAGAGFPLSGRVDSKSQSIQARGGATLKTERAAVCKTAAPRHR